MADQKDSIPAVSSHSVIIPDHELVRLIGTGSYGEVWLARSALGTYRAVKIVHGKKFSNRRPFEREFSGVQKTEPISRLHDGLVDVLQVGRNEGGDYFYYVMELADDCVNGQVIDPNKYQPRTLAYDIAEPGKLAVAECRRIGVDLASALHFLHSRGLIHRDVKPSNVIFVNGKPKLADVGLVAEIREARSYVGTDGFIPPEGPGTVQADVYSLGKVLYEISTGYDRHDYPELPTRLGDSPQDDQLLELNRIILRACRTDPRQRYKSARAIELDLRGLNSDEKTFVSRVKRSLRSRAGILAPIAIACIVGGIFVASHNRRLARATPQSFAGLPEVAPAPVPAGLVGWWRAESNAWDSAGKNNGIFPDSASFTPGKVGKAFLFDGLNDHIRVSNSPDLQLTNALTVEAWVFPKAFGGLSHEILCKRNLFPGNQRSYDLECDTSGRVRLNVSSDGGSTSMVSVSSTNSLPLNQWSHVAGTYDGAWLKIYVNGQLESQEPWSLGVFPGNADLGIGAVVEERNSGFHFAGNIDEVALYNRALSPDEIARIYRADTAGKRERSTHCVPAPDGMICWWSAEGNALDNMGQSDGTLMNGVSFAPGKVGQAFSFDGVHSHIRIADQPLLRFTDGLSIEVWVLPARLGVFQELISKWDLAIGSKQKSFSMGIYPDGRTFLISSPDGTDSGVAIVSSTNCLTPMQWTHVLATYDGGYLKMYLNGRMQDQLECSFWPFPGTNNLAIGGVVGGAPVGQVGSPFAGLIDEPAIYNRALSAEEVRSIYEAGSAGKCVTVPARHSNPTSGPVSLWNGDDSPIDSIGNNHGVLKGDIAFGAGKIGRAFALNGSNSFVLVQSSASLKPRGPFTVQAWVNYDRITGPNGDTIVMKGADAEVPADWALAIGWRRKLQPHVNLNGGWYYFDCNTTLNTGVWYHVAMVYDGEAIRGYVNGVQDWKLDISGTVQTSDEPIKIGAYISTNAPANGNFFSGFIDEVSIYDRALTAKELESIYMAGKSGQQASVTDRITTK